MKKIYKNRIKLIITLFIFFMTLSFMVNKSPHPILLYISVNLYFTVLITVFIEIIKNYNR